MLFLFFHFLQRILYTFCSPCHFCSAKCTYALSLQFQLNARDIQNAYMESQISNLAFSKSYIFLRVQSWYVVIVFRNFISMCDILRMTECLCQLSCKRSCSTRVMNPLYCTVSPWYLNLFSFYENSKVFTFPFALNFSFYVLEINMPLPLICCWIVYRGWKFV